MKYSQVTVHIVLENIQRTKQYKSLISLVECSIPLVCVWHLFAKLSCDSCGLTYLSISNLHFIFSSPVQSSFTPESCRLLLFMFSSFRLVSDPRTAARAEQLLFVKLQSFNLQ